MNFYTPRIINADSWDKEMADASSMTEPLQDSNDFDLMNTKLNPESVNTVFAFDDEDYSNFSAGVLLKCNSRYPPPRGKRRKPKYLKCLRDEQHKRNLKKEEKGKAGGVFGTGVGAGRRKACKELGLTGSEKRECARELRARGWKKGMSIPPDMMGITIEDIEMVDSGLYDDIDDAQGGRFLDEKTQEILIYSGIALVGVIGVFYLISGIRTAMTTASS